MKIRKTFLLDEGLIEIIRKIKDDNHQPSETAVVIEAVMALYRKLNPSYVVTRTESRAKTPEEKAEEKVRIAEHKKKLAEDGYLAIVEKLGGRVINKPDGKYAQYYTYHKNTRYLQEMPLEMMSDDLCDAQYSPNKEDVLGRQERGEVNYKLNTWDE